MRTAKTALFVATSLFACATAAPATTSAQSDDGKQLELAVAPEKEVGWNEEWERFRWWEYIGTGVLGGFALTAKTLLAPPERDAFGGGTGFDEALYGAIRPSTAAGYSTHATISDIGFYGSLIFLIGDALVTGFAHDAWDLSFQILMMDLEILAMVGGTLWIPQYLGLGRERPIYTTCGEPGHIGADCSRTNIQYRSWYAGHPATAAAVAGATCTHHYFSPLYGGGFGDAAICGAMIGVAAVTGIARTVSGRHWPTDVLAGWALGATYGWLLPIGLHYGFTRDSAEADLVQNLRVLPVVYEGDHAGVTLGGRF